MDFLRLMNFIVSAFAENSKTDMIFYLHGTGLYEGYSTLHTDQYHAHEGTVVKHCTTMTLIIFYSQQHANFNQSDHSTKANTTAFSVKEPSMPLNEH